MTIEELARKQAKAIPNSKLVKYYEAAIPQFCMDMTLIMEKEKPLSVIQEFVLRFVAEEIHEISLISNFLGINDKATYNAVAELQTLGLLVVDIGNMKIKFTEKGKEALKYLKTIIPQEIEYSLFMDGLSGEIYITDTKKYTNNDVKHLSLRTIPPNLEQPQIQDIHFEEVRVAIAKYRKNNYYSRDKLEGNLLDISHIDKVYTEYNKVYVLVYLSNTEDIELRVFERQTRKLEYEDILLHMYNKNMQIFDFDEKQEREDVKEVTFYDLISDEVKTEAHAYSQREAELDQEIEQLKVQLEEITDQDDETKDEQTQSQIDKIEKQIKLREEEKAVSTRILSTYDHRPLLTKALKEATNIVVIVSPWIKYGGLNGEILNLIRSAVTRGVRVIIGYGISEEVDSDKRILNELKKIKSGKGKLEIIALNNTHEKVLIKDNDYLVVTSFNWLSFRGDPRKGFRQETGIYTEAADNIVDMKKDLAIRMKTELV